MHGRFSGRQRGDRYPKQKELHETNLRDKFMDHPGKGRRKSLIERLVSPSGVLELERGK